MTGTLIPEGESFPAEKLGLGSPRTALGLSGRWRVWGRVGALGTESWLSRLSALELVGRGDSKYGCQVGSRQWFTHLI